MSQTHTLQGLVTDLQTQKTQAADYIVNPKILKMEGGLIHAPKTKGLIYTPNEVFHQGLQTKLAIPSAYYRRMQDYRPFKSSDLDLSLLDHTVNSWMKSLDNSGIMLRSFEANSGNVARAFLSDRYAALDNMDVLLAALEAIKKSGIKVEIRECDVTDKRMYINVVAPEIEIQAKETLRNYLKHINVGDGIISGFCMTNSEVGLGKFEIRARALILRCKNGMCSMDDRFHKTHLGAKLEAGTINWSERTKKRNMELVISQTEDAITEFLSKDYLNGMIKKLEKASNTPLEHPLDTVQNVCRELDKVIMMDEARKTSILNHFLIGGDNMASGVFNAITKEAQAMNADERFEAETLAFDLLGKIKNFDKPIHISKN